MDSSLVICIGNDLVADDGVGHVIYHGLQKLDLPPNTRLKLLGLGGINLIENLAGEDHLIIIDAVQFGAPPGTIHSLNWDQLPQTTPHPVSGHGIGVREAIEVTRRLYPEKTPQRIHLIGVEGKVFDQLGGGLSLEVSNAVESAISEVLRLLNLPLIPD